MQCIEVCSGQQQGELSLQLGDTINVMQKTSDGTVATQPCYSGFNKSRINEGLFFICMLIHSWSFVGFLEGRRVQDGQRGWFSTACVVEITNEHVQRRHLRQRYHVLQTATRLLKQRSGVLELPTTKCFIWETVYIAICLFSLTDLK